VQLFPATLCESCCKSHVTIKACGCLVCECNIKKKDQKNKKIKERKKVDEKLSRALSLSHLSGLYVEISTPSVEQDKPSLWCEVEFDDRDYSNNAHMD
jgi:hypothetical protein